MASATFVQLRAELMNEKCIDNQSLEMIEELLGIHIKGYKFVTSGMANNVFRMKMEKGSIIVKICKERLPNIFKYESDALDHLGSTKTVNVPQVFYVSKDFLIMEDLGSECKEISQDSWRTFGRQFGALHKVESINYGYPNDNYLGIWIQKNQYKKRWIDFYSENRVLCYLESGHNAEIFTDSDRNGILRLLDQLERIIPEEKPVLCHGDFWINNIFRKSNGQVYVIDPAIHYGLAEADLAMTKLYGGFPQDFYDGYLEINPLLPGWEDRLPFYQLKEQMLMVAQTKHEASLVAIRNLISKYS